MLLVIVSTSARFLPKKNQSLTFYPTRKAWQNHHTPSFFLVPNPEVEQAQLLDELQFASWWGRPEFKHNLRERRDQ